MQTKYNLPLGSIITREVRFAELSDREQEMITKGFKDYLNHVPEVKEKSYREVNELLRLGNPQLIFYKLNGNEQFKMRMSPAQVLYKTLENSEHLD